MTEGVLIVGYGNVLRTDDGLGRRAAELLEKDPRLDGAMIVGCHQLTPELALDVGGADLVVLVDASHGPAAGTFTVDRVEATGNRQTAISHQLSPAGLVDLACELYGRAPDVFLVSVGVESFDFGDRLTAVAERALPGVMDAVVELVRGRADTTLGQPVSEHGRA